MNRVKAALLTLIKGTPLSLRDPTHWRNRDEDTITGVAMTENAVLGLSTAWACVNLLVGTQASLPVMVYRAAKDGSRELAKDHPLYRVLHDSPNSQQTALDFWEFVCASLELRGNGYARKVKNKGKVVGLVPIYPDLMSVRQLSGGRIGYRWTLDGKSYDETDETVLHIRGFGGSPLGGLSTLEYGRKTFDLATGINASATQTFKNGLRPNVVVAFKEFLTPAQRKDVEDALAAKYQGAMNAGRPFIAEGGQTVSTISMKPEDAQMLESRAFSVEEICRLFGVPPHMVGHTEKSTSWGTGIEQQTLGFVKFTLRRRLKRIEQALQKQLLTADDVARGITIEFNLEGLLRGDSAGRSAFYGSALNNGWMTINEVRALENLPPVEGGEVPRMQSQNVPITQAGAQETEDAV
ncbi:phage portal protein [Devosia sp. WQ 349]|uniref:phage portal protein n=1 Tax=Devosia sp. WQ 349K1 TaxID=2800329 RepID=UPI001906A40A|nr:phage portal protein [Devosia sp. WQ 349K1]MBK1793370.1 phage portal protein [Devosia sp. WQ 349K1]